MTDPILVESSDLDLYATHKVAEAEAAMRAKIKGCKPIAPEPTKRVANLSENIDNAVKRGIKLGIDRFTANLIATGLMEGGK